MISLLVPSATRVHNTILLGAAFLSAQRRLTHLSSFASETHVGEGVLGGNGNVGHRRGDTSEYQEVGRLISTVEPATST
jgi:hypothetical protein